MLFHPLKDLTPGAMATEDVSLYWKHICKLAHLGLPIEASRHIQETGRIIITAKKRLTDVELTMTLDTGESFSASISLKEILNTIGKYRVIARNLKTEVYQFNDFVAEHLFGLNINKKADNIRDAENDDSLKTMFDKAFSLSSTRLNLVASSDLYPTRRPLRILIASMRSYPFGGGEAWLIESSTWLQQQGHHVILINFKEQDWSLISSNSCDLVKGIPRIGIKMVDTDQKVMDYFNEAMKHYVPDIIHTQGEINQILNQNYDPRWPPLVCGYHFWNGIINLGKTGNKKMLSHSTALSLNSNFSKACSYPRYHPYIVSPFMRDVLVSAGYMNKIDIVSPAEKRISRVENLTSVKWSFDFLQLNCSILKGGICFITLAERMSHKKFYGLCPVWEEVVELYEKAKEEGFDVKLDGDTLIINSNSCIRWTWVDNVSEIILKTRVLLSLSLVDETYGRVIAEAIELGRPAIASPNGNHKYLLPPKYLVEPEEISDLEVMANELVSSEAAWTLAIRNQQEHLIHNTNCGKEAFINLIHTESANCFFNHVAIMAPWSEQGLGYHAKTYADALKVSGIEPHIYSFQSYAADNIGLSIQSNTAEWNDYDVHFSYNHRESLTAREVHQFCMHKNCKVLLALEICWEVNWARLRELASLGLDVILIPNPETIRSKEILYHKAFPRVLCTTTLVENILNSNNVMNTTWIGHGFGGAMHQDAINRRMSLLSEYVRNGKIILTHIAGYNHRRKMTLEIIKTLAPILRDSSGITLRVLSQIPFSEDCYKYANDIKSIKMIHGRLSHNDIMEEYRNASFSLQLSTHEGLGLGFYESISCGTPVITINKQPHNEPVVDGETGLLIDAEHMDLYDNDDALINGGIFSASHLTSIISNLSPQMALDLTISCMAKHTDELSLQALATRLSQALQPFI